MLTTLAHCPLFAGLTDDQIQDCLGCCHAVVSSYDRGQSVFRQGDAPENLLVLLSGAVRITALTTGGQRRVIAAFHQPGELFGEVFLFLPDAVYEHSAEAAAPAKVLCLPRDFFFYTKGCDYHEKLVFNLLSVFADKAYYLNKRVQILSCGSLRQKLARILLHHAEDGVNGQLPMDREGLAEFLSVTRPSVSRELARMQAEGLIEISRSKFRLLDREALEELAF